MDAKKRPVLRRIDIIVFPLWKRAEELSTPNGKRKFEQWLKQIELSAKTKDTAFIVIHDKNYAKDSPLDAKLKHTLEKFAHERYFVLPNEETAQKFLNFGLSNFIKRSFVLGTAVEIRRYGQHARMCVDATGASFSEALARRLLFWGAATQDKAVDGLSIKRPVQFSLARAEERFPQMSEREKDVLRDELFSLRERNAFHASKLAHAFRRSRTPAGVVRKIKRIK